MWNYTETKTLTLAEIALRLLESGEARALWSGTEYADLITLALDMAQEFIDQAVTRRDADREEG